MAFGLMSAVAVTGLAIIVVLVALVSCCCASLPMQLLDRYGCDLALAGAYLAIVVGFFSVLLMLAIFT